MSSACVYLCSRLFLHVSLSFLCLVCLIPSPCCVTQRCVSTSNRSQCQGKRLRFSSKGRVSLHEEIELISWFAERENDQNCPRSIPQSSFDFTEQVHSLPKGPPTFNHFYSCVSMCVFQGSCPTCRGTRLAPSLLLLSLDLPCPPTPHLGAHCILGWVHTPRVAPQALMDLKDRNMDIKVRGCT